MQMRRLVGMLGLVVLAAAPAAADVTMEARVGMLGQGQTTMTRTSGQKERQDMEIPMVGTTVVITRVDRGVQWTLDPKRKLYEEKPLAYPYTKEKESTVVSTSSSTLSAETEMKPEECRMESVPGPRTVAGFQASGSKLVCGAGQDYMVTWIAPYTGELARGGKELEAYQQALTRAQFANYPPAEREEMIKGLKMLGEAMKGMPNAPKGIPLATDSTMEHDDGSRKLVTMYEVTRLSLTPVDPQLFELPAGYTKVDDLAQVQAQEMLRGMGIPESMMAPGGMPAMPGMTNAPAGDGSWGANDGAPDPVVGGTGGGYGPVGGGYSGSGYGGYNEAPPTPTQGSTDTFGAAMQGMQQARQIMQQFQGLGAGFDAGAGMDSEVEESSEYEEPEEEPSYEESE